MSETPPETVDRVEQMFDNRGDDGPVPGRERGPGVPSDAVGYGSSATGGAGGWKPGIWSMPLSLISNGQVASGGISTVVR